MTDQADPKQNTGLSTWSFSWIRTWYLLSSTSRIAVLLLLIFSGMYAHPHSFFNGQDFIDFSMVADHSTFFLQIFILLTAVVTAIVLGIEGPMDSKDDTSDLLIANALLNEIKDDTSDLLIANALLNEPAAGQQKSSFFNKFNKSSSWYYAFIIAVDFFIVFSSYNAAFELFAIVLRGTHPGLEEIHLSFFQHTFSANEMTIYLAVMAVAAINWLVLAHYDCGVERTRHINRQGVSHLIEGYIEGTEIADKPALWSYLASGKDLWGKAKSISFYLMDFFVQLTFRFVPFLYLPSIILNSVDPSYPLLLCPSFFNNPLAYVSLPANATYFTCLFVSSIVAAVFWAGMKVYRHLESDQVMDLYQQVTGTIDQPKFDLGWSFGQVNHHGNSIGDLSVEAESSDVSFESFKCWFSGFKDFKALQGYIVAKQPKDLSSQEIFKKEGTSEPVVADQISDQSDNMNCFEYCLKVFRDSFKDCFPSDSEHKF